MLNKSALKDFNKSIVNLEEVLGLEKSSVVRDCAIKRFEICFDLGWKSIKVYAKSQGLECFSPKRCFKIAFQLDILEHDEKWMEMINDRSLSVHIYQEEYADKVYSRLNNYLNLFKNLYSNLIKNIEP